MQLAECAALNSVPGATCSWLALRIALNRARLCLPAWVSQCNNTPPTLGWYSVLAYQWNPPKIVPLDRSFGRL